MKEKLIQVCKEALKKEVGIYVMIQAPDCEKEEIIINPSCNVEFKMNYYKNAYDDELKLKSFDKIRIVGFGMVTNEVIEESNKNNLIDKAI